MKLPWSKKPEPLAPSKVFEALKFPQLLGVLVKPVLYNGVPSKWKLVFMFDRGEIVIGQSFNQEAMNELRDEIKRELNLA